MEAPRLDAPSRALRGLPLVFERGTIGTDCADIAGEVSLFVHLVCVALAALFPVIQQAVAVRVSHEAASPTCHARVYGISAPETYLAWPMAVSVLGLRPLLILAPLLVIRNLHQFVLQMQVAAPVSVRLGNQRCPCGIDLCHGRAIVRHTVFIEVVN